MMRNGRTVEGICWECPSPSGGKGGTLRRCARHAEEHRRRQRIRDRELKKQVGEAMAVWESPGRVAKLVALSEQAARAQSAALRRA